MPPLSLTTLLIKRSIHYYPLTEYVAYFHRFHYVCPIPLRWARGSSMLFQKWHPPPSACSGIRHFGQVLNIMSSVNSDPHRWQVLLPLDSSSSVAFSDVGGGFFVAR